MKPAPFKLYVPEEEQEILALLHEYGSEARILAGGQSLVPLMNMRIMQPKVLISLHRCSTLGYMREQNNGYALGARTHQAEIEDSDLVATQLPLLSAAMPYVGVRASRNYGTICGSLAHADPLAELPSVAAAMEAQFEIVSVRGKREVGPDEFYLSALSNCLEPDEMLRQVRIPKALPESRSVFLEVSNRVHGFALVGLALHASINADGVCRKARLAAMGLSETTLRLRSAEKLLEGNVLTDELIEQASVVSTDTAEPHSDIHADGKYRRRVASTLVKRALLKCSETVN